MRLAKYIYLYRKFCQVNKLDFRLPYKYQFTIPTSWITYNMDSWTALVAQVVYNDMLDYLREICEVELSTAEQEKLLNACYQRHVLSTISQMSISHNNKHMDFFAIATNFMSWMRKKV